MTNYSDTVTTHYGSWLNINHHSGGDTLDSAVQNALADGMCGDMDTDAIADAYRYAINDALPPGVQLCGNEFYGPAHEYDCHFGGYPLDEDGRLDIAAIIDAVDFWAIVVAFTTAAGPTMPCMDRLDVIELARTLRWLQREAALQWRDGLGNLPAEDRIERRGAAIAYGRVATHLETLAEMTP